MNDAGNGSFVTPGIVVDGELVTTNLVDINLGLRILLGSSFYDDWDQEEPFVSPRPAGQPGGSAASVEPDHAAQAPEAGLRQELQLGDEPTLAGRAHRGPPRVGYRRRAAGQAVGHGSGRARGHRLRQGHGQQRGDQPARDLHHARDELRVEDTGAGVQHPRAGPGAGLLHSLLRGPGRLLRGEGPRARARREIPRSSRSSRFPTRPSAAASTRRCAGCSRTTW